jgi:trigger factor
MKRILGILLAVLILAISLTGCGTIERYNYTKGLKDYVELCNLDEIKIDRSSADYIKLNTDLMQKDLATYTQKVTEGKVAKGDVSNIDYAGKVDGVAFTGGTAKDQTLEIGSGQFIEGFEDQLIGVKIGSTVDIKVTFPADYGDSTDLATGSKTITLSGAKAVFTVTINYVERTYAEVNDEFAVAAGFKTADEYMADLEKRTDEQYVVNYVVENSTFELPDDKEGNTYSYYKNYYTEMAKYYNMTFEDFLASNTLDENAFKKDVLGTEIILYACFDELGLKVPANIVDEKAEEYAKESGTTKEELIKQYTANYIECIYVEEQAVKTLVEKVLANSQTK